MLPPCALHRVDPQCLPPFLRSTGWTNNFLLACSLHRLGPQCLISLYSTQGGTTMSYFLVLYTGWNHNVLLPLLYTGWNHNVLFPCNLHRVEPQCLTCFTLHRVGPQCLTSMYITQGGATMSYFLLLCTGWNPHCLLYSCRSIKHHASTLASKMLYLYFVQLHDRIASLCRISSLVSGQ